jgi:hypothetical protein
VAFEAAADMVAQVKNRRILDAVKDVETFFTPPQDAGLHEGLEVTRDVGLGRARRFHETVDGPLSFDQGVQELQPHWLSEDAKSLRDKVQEILGGRFGFKTFFWGYRA